MKDLLIISFFLLAGINGFGQGEAPYQINGIVYEFADSSLNTDTTYISNVLIQLVEEDSIYIETRANSRGEFFLFYDIDLPTNYSKLKIVLSHKNYNNVTMKNPNPTNCFGGGKKWFWFIEMERKE